MNDERRADHYSCSVSRRFTSKISARSHNLFPDVIPYDSTRVVLSTRFRGSDYINASWLNKAEEEEPYASPLMTPYMPFSKINIITTQYPMKHTQVQYYQMLYENHVEVVVDICCRDEFKATELELEDEQHFDHLNVKTSKGKLITPFLALRKVEVCNSNDNHKQELRSLKFVAWPTVGLNEKAREDREKLLSAISLMRKLIGKDKTTMNMVVQDSSGGVGGAAVFVILLQLLEAIDVSIDNANADGELSFDAMTSLNILQAVNVMRKKRAKLVNTLAKYRFMCDCLVDYAQEKSYFVG